MSRVFTVDSDNSTLKGNHLHLRHRAKVLLYEEIKSSANGVPAQTRIVLVYYFYLMHKL